MPIKPILTIDQMVEHENLLFSKALGDPFQAMEAAGLAVTHAIQAHRKRGLVVVLCGPGNNGGDGYSCARQLLAAGYEVCVCAMALSPKASNHAVKMQHLWKNKGAGAVRILPLAAAQKHILQADILVDALFGIGLTRLLDAPEIVRLAAVWNRQNQKLRIAIDIPSGLHADSGIAQGVVFQADVTVALGFLKPAHILAAGLHWCGAVVYADIGLAIDVTKRENQERSTQTLPPQRCPEIGQITGPLHCVPRDMAHKYRRGHALIYSGNALATGASRLAALAAARSTWVGAVSLLGDREALLVHAHHVSAIMLKEVINTQQLNMLLAEPRPLAFLIGPAAGLNDQTRAFVLAALATAIPIVLDADALTLFSKERETLIQAIAARGSAITVLTPHEGEFARLFPDIVHSDNSAGNSKITRALTASQCTGAIIALKGPDTIIASPGGRVIVSTHASPWLATAGSGDVLAGLITAALAALQAAGNQGDALACIAEAVFVHGEAGRRAGPGLVAEDLPAQFPAIWRRWLEKSELS